MSEYTVVKCFPGDTKFKEFIDFPNSIYPENSPRFVLGHDPVKYHLEGCYLMKKEGTSLGRFAIYNNPELIYESERACTIGSFECVDDQNIANELLNRASEIAKKLGFRYLIGPMEGSTWFNYRFSDYNNYPNFFMEPYHHDYYANLFKGYGFKSIGEFVSNLDTNVEYDQEKIDRFEKKYLALGATFRNLNTDDLENELRKIGEFCNKAFQRNFLFTPIDVDLFVQKYLEIKDCFNPELIWIVEGEEGDIHSIFFPIKDVNDPTGKTLIIKTMARKRYSPFDGIVRYMGELTLKMAKENGFERVIHAFILNDNFAKRISQSYSGQKYKSYHLYGIEL